MKKARKIFPRGLEANQEFDLIRRLKSCTSQTNVGILPEYAHDPHVMGWAHQEIQAKLRQESYRTHIQLQEKHSNTVVATQVFTPSWIADALAKECFEISGVAECLDPACGAGQMLFSWLRVLVDSGVDLKEAVRCVHGMDLDPRSVEVTRQALLRLLIDWYGEVPEGFEDVVRSQIRLGNALLEGQERDVVLMNPPYMGSRGLSDSDRVLVSSFGPYSHDLYAAFIHRADVLSKKALGVLAPQTFWFTQRFETAREDLCARRGLQSFLHLGAGAFPGLTGEKSSVVAFVCGDQKSQSAKFWDLRDDKGPEKSERHKAGAFRTQDINQFFAIPGRPMAHWLDSKEIELFARFPPLSERFEVPGAQNKTANNARYVHDFQEVPVSEIQSAWGLHSGSKSARYLFYSKGGGFAPWWGNWGNVVDFGPDAQDFYAKNKTSNLVNERFLNRSGLCYTDFGGLNLSARFMPKGTTFDMTGPAIFHPDDSEDELFALMVLLNSSIASRLLVAMNPSLHFQVREVRALPLPEPSPAMAAIGRELALVYQTVHARLLDSAERRHGGLTSQRSRSEIEELEEEAERVASLAYGVEPVRRPPHSIWKKIRD